MKKLSFINKGFVPSASMEAEVDLDTSPIMNVLVILIPFLASVAVYTRLSILEMSLPPNVEANVGIMAEKPKIKITVVLSPQYMAITYGENMLDSLPIKERNYDITEFKEKLALRRQIAEEKNEIIIAVKDPVVFQNVVRIMDACRSCGFGKIGLAGATENPQEGQ